MNNNSPVPRLDEIIAGFLRAEQAGTAPDQDELIAHYADLAESLKAFFANHKWQWWGCRSALC